MERVFPLHFAILAGTLTAAFAGPPTTSATTNPITLETELELGKMQLHEAVAVNYWLVESFLSGQLDAGIAKVVEQDDVVKKFALRWDPLAGYPETSKLLVDWQQIRTEGDVDFHLAADNAFGGTIELSRQLDLMNGFVRMTNVPKGACEALLAETLFAGVQSIEITSTRDHELTIDDTNAPLRPVSADACSDTGNVLIWNI